MRKRVEISSKPVADAVAGRADRAESGSNKYGDIRLILPNYIDCRDIDIKKEFDKKWCDDTFKGWIEQSLNPLIKIIPRWDRNFDYYESRQTPPGFSSDALQKFVDANTGALKPDEDNYIFFPDNKIKDVVDGNVGEYTSVKKQIIVKSDDNPRNDKIEYAFQKSIDRFERKKKAWQIVRRPAIRDMIICGTGWTGMKYNPERNQPYGEILFNNISPRDMLIDVNTRAEFYNDRKYEIQMIEMEMDEAKQFLYENYGITESIAADEDYRSNHPNEEERNLNTDYTTFYMVEYKKTYKSHYNLSSKYNMDVKNKDTMLKSEDEYYFVALYHKSLGTIFHEINPYKQFLKTPYCNKKSGRELYCLDDIWDLAVVQDIINITKSLYLDNAKMRNYIRIVIKDKLKAELGDSLDTFIRFGGDLEISEEDDVRKAIQFMEVPSLPKEMLGFIDVAERVMKEQSQRYEPMRGEYPKGKYLAEDTFKGLVQENRKIFSYKDDAINYAGNEEGNLIYKIMSVEYKDEDYVDIVGVKKGDPQYIPINSIMTLQSYEDYLKESKTLGEQEIMMLNEIKENDPAYLQKKFQILKPASDRFASSSEVEFVYKMQDNFGNDIHPVEVWKRSSMVFINQFCDDEKMDVKISMDFDSKRNEEEDRMWAKYMLEKFGEPMLPIFLDKMGGTWQDKKDEILKLMEKANEGKMLIAEIQKRGPEFFSYLQKMMQQWDIANAANMGNRGGAQAVAVQ